MLLRPDLFVRQLHLPRQLRLSESVILGYRAAMTRSRPIHVVEAALSEHRSALRRFVAARAPAADVDDALQIAAMRALEKAHTLADKDRVLPWLYQIHRTTIVDLARKNVSEKRKIDALAAQPHDAFAVAEADENSACGCSLVQSRQLNTRYSAILEMVDISGGSLKEAARALGVTVNTATVRLHRARKALKERLMAHCGVETMKECNDCRCTSDGCCPT